MIITMALEPYRVALDLAVESLQNWNISEIASVTMIHAQFVKGTVMKTLIALETSNAGNKGLTRVTKAF